MMNGLMSSKESKCGPICGKIFREVEINRMGGVRGCVFRKTNTETKVDSQFEEQGEEMTHGDSWVQVRASI